MFRSTIVVRNQKEMIHRYEHAPEEVSFLREWHRHMLHIETEIEVTHDDRELEFIMVKDYINQCLDRMINLEYVEKSCEMVAKEIIAKLVERYGERAIECTVWEDNENGGRVYYRP